MGTSLPEIKSTARITTSGLPDSGKTVFTRYLAYKAMPDVFIYDPLDQYSGFPDDKRYVPQSDSMAEFEMICGRMCSVANTLFIIEEAERYLREGRPLGEHAFAVVNRGRNWGIGIIAVTRRIQELSKTYFDLCSDHFFFRCGLRSRAYLTQMIGKPMALKVENLPQYYFLHYRIGDTDGTIGTLELPQLESHQIVLGGKK